MDYFKRLLEWVRFDPPSAAKHIQDLEEVNKIMKESLEMAYPVLQFYANDENYTYQEPEIKWGENITHFKQSEIEKDRGEKARKLLRLE